MSTWHDLPGPGTFCDAVSADVRDGRTVAVEFPEHGPRGLAEAVRTRLGNDWTWRPVDAAAGQEPLELLYARCLSRSETVLRTSQAFAAESELDATVIWVDVRDEATASGWRRFAQTYAEATRGLDGDHARVIVCAHGCVPLGTPLGDVVVRRWVGIVSPLDALFFATRLRGLREASPLMARVAVEIVSRLARYDTEAAARLARLSFEELHAPLNTLQALAAERMWVTGEEMAANDRWARGMGDETEGREVTHAAWDAARGRGEAIERAIWSAQAAVVLPFIEERRRDLLDALGSVLDVPYEYPVGREVRCAGTVEDLEIGMIHRQLRTKAARVGQSVVDLARALRDARNDLSHLCLLPASRFRTPAFLDPDRVIDAASQRLRTGQPPSPLR